MNERKIRILEAIIQDYIQTGFPVGSRTLSRKYDLGVSSATIRNEMSDLEELGLITQPHTSAGRIPSDKGYRLYVDNLMDRPEIEPDLEAIITKVLQDKITTVDTLLEETARLISMMTNYTTIASATIVEVVSIKHLQLVPVDSKSVACVIVTNTNNVKHHIVNTHLEIDFGVCNLLTESLNDCLVGATASTVKQANLQHLQIPQHFLDDLLYAIEDTLKEEDAKHIYTRGKANILDFEEFKDGDKARDLLELLEEKPYLKKLLSPTPGASINITIGEENALEPMKQCSLITTTYQLGNYTLGTIGIIGPKRMNYGEVVSLLEHISCHITNMLSDD
ncbi:MAG: heat-inducible transcription repressor HrcA [Epulopiscium sp. Nele67-Bin005]|nr:MAG: heat-inducible transcription repressor HrcA [Epulopiscium sp. Nele67-Bin005]